MKSKDLKNNDGTTEGTAITSASIYNRFVAPMDTSKATWRDDPHT